MISDFPFKKLSQKDKKISRIIFSFETVTIQHIVIIWVFIFFVSQRIVDSIFTVGKRGLT